MRKILFRGKRTNNGEWVKGFYIQKPNPFSEDGKPIRHCIIDLPPFGYDVDPETVGQFTGLCDKNGKRIFEGDVLQFFEKRLVVWWNEEAFQWQAQERKEVTCTYSGASTCGIFDNIDLGRIYAEIPCLGKMSTEVIGNRWDNPELLEEVSDNG